MVKISVLLNKLDIMIPNPKCELAYSKGYELLIATVLSSQSRDARVNKVTKILWDKYTLEDLSKANLTDIEKIIYPVGTYHKKAIYIKNIASKLISDYNGVVPNDRKYLESLDGVGRKTCNVVLANIYGTPTIAVDTHVYRTSIRLGLAMEGMSVNEVEKVLCKNIPQSRWIRTHYQLVLFGRYICKAKNPLCNKCLLNSNCTYRKE